jgi:hypothetical protein
VIIDHHIAQRVALDQIALAHEHIEHGNYPGRVVAVM